MEDLLNYIKEMIYEISFIPKSRLENNNRLNLESEREFERFIERLRNDNNIEIK